MKSYFVIIGILVIIITGLITLNIFFQQSLQLETAEQFNKQQLLLSKSIAFNIKAYMHFMKEELLHISNIVIKKHIRSAEELKWLSEQIKTDTTIKADFGILSETGGIIFFQGDESLIKSFAKEIIDNAKGLSPAKPHIYAAFQNVYIAYPRFEYGKLKETLFISISIDDISKYFLEGIASGKKGYAWMMNKAGTLLYHPTQPAMVGGNIYQTEKKCFNCHVNFDIVKKIIEGKTSNYGRYIAPTGTDKIIAFSTIDIDKVSWVIAVSSPFSEVTATTRKSMELYSYLIISIFVVASMVSGVLIVFNRKMIQAEEKARHQQELETYALELEKKVDERTAELSSEKEKLNTIVSAIGAGIVLIGKDGKIAWSNENMKELVGHEILGLSCEDLCSDCSILFENKTIDDLTTVIMSNLFGHKDRYFQVTNAPIKGAGGELHGHIRLIQDITDMKKMEEQIIHSEKLASIGRLAAGIAHEIGNPMTSIFSFVQILREMETDEFKKESLETIYFHINRISEILKQLSGFTKIPAEEAKPCRINEIIEASTNLIQYDKKAKNVIITKELSQDMPEIVIDCNRLSQVFVNLILNAVDAMTDGGSLNIISMIKNGSIVIEFKDTGIGIEKENTPKIFDPFFTTKEKGTGLGLAVSYNIIKKMNGEMKVESEYGKGTVFTITLPIKTNAI
jgi:PAS domain S-box-containing protein